MTLQHKQTRGPADAFSPNDLRAVSSMAARVPTRPDFPSAGGVMGGVRSVDYDSSCLCGRLICLLRKAPTAVFQEFLRSFQEHLCGLEAQHEHDIVVPVQSHHIATSGEIKIYSDPNPSIQVIPAGALDDHPLAEKRAEATYLFVCSLEGLGGFNVPLL